MSYVWILDYGPIHFCADEIQKDVDKFRHHLATIPAIDWEEASTQSE